MGSLASSMLMIRLTGKNNGSQEIWPPDSQRPLFDKKTLLQRQLDAA